MIHSTSSISKKFKIHTSKEGTLTSNKIPQITRTCLMAASMISGLSTRSPMPKHPLVTGFSTE